MLGLRSNHSAHSSSLDPRLPLGLDRLFKIAAFGWVDPIHGETAILQKVGKGCVLARIFLNGKFVEFNEPSFEGKRANVVDGLAVYDLPHTAALLHTIVKAGMSLAAHPEHGVVAYDA